VMFRGLPGESDNDMEDFRDLTDFIKVPSCHNRIDKTENTRQRGKYPITTFKLDHPFLIPLSLTPHPSIELYNSILLFIQY